LLAYLDMLCAALLAREEAYAIARLGTNTKRAPIHTLNFYHQTVQLLGSHTEPVPADAAPPVETQPAPKDQGPDQLELPLVPRTRPERRAG
jgi:hypothetical protein